MSEPSSCPTQLTLIGVFMATIAPNPANIGRFGSESNVRSRAGRSRFDACALKGPPTPLSQYRVWPTTLGYKRKINIKQAVLDSENHT